MLSHGLNWRGLILVIYYCLQLINWMDDPFHEVRPFFTDVWQLESSFASTPYRYVKRDWNTFAHDLACPGFSGVSLSWFSNLRS